MPVCSRRPKTRELLDAMAAHRARADRLLDRHPRKLPDGSTHPVWGFLFTYYSYRPAQLRRWHPGFGVLIPARAAGHYRGHSGYISVDDAIAISGEHLQRRLGTVEYIDRLLAATESRPARLNCFGMHEWAMLYRADDEQIRHAGVPLRLGAHGTDSVVESMELRCTHFDAFRFFTESAAPRNALPLTRADQAEHEQPGCVHAGMDLYKWAYKLSPLIDSDIVADAFELALDLRELDMCASPYDLRHLGFAPVPVETPAGRAEYARRQAELSLRAGVVRTGLRDRCQHLLDAAQQSAHGAGAIVTCE